MYPLVADVQPDQCDQRAGKIRRPAREGAKSAPAFGDMLETQGRQHARGHHGQGEADAEAQDRSHPLFDPLFEQYETAIQRIQQQRSQHVLVKLPERDGVLQAQIPRVPRARISVQQLEAWKRYLARRRGKAYAQLETEIAHRTKQFGISTIQAAIPVTPTDQDLIWR